MPAPSSAPHPARMRPSPALPWEQWRHKGKEKSLDWDRRKGKKTSPKVAGRGDNSCTRQGSSAGGASDSAKWFSWGGGSPPGPLQASGQPEVQAEDKRAVQHWGGERTPRLHGPLSRGLLCISPCKLKLPAEPRLVWVAQPGSAHGQRGEGSVLGQASCPPGRGLLPAQHRRNHAQGHGKLQAPALCRARAMG